HSSRTPYLAIPLHVLLSLLSLPTALPLYSLSLFFHSSPALRHLHSFPTRRSSDLFQQPDGFEGFDECRGVGFVTRHADAAFRQGDRKSTRLNSSHGSISYAVFCLKKKTNK